MKLTLIRDTEDWQAVEKQIELEGDTVGQGTELDLRTRFVPLSVLEAVGLETTDGPPTGFVTRWFDGEWHPQEFLGCRIRGVMNENLGLNMVSGYGGRYGHVEGVWTPELAGLLKEMEIRNFVTLGLNGGKIACCQSGVPFPGLFCLLEGIPSRLAKWLIEPRELMESCVVSIVVTRYPWPFQESHERASVGGITSGLLKHFWSTTLKSHRKGYYVDDTFVGVSTGWARNFGEANARALVSCWTLQVSGKQFRTDLGAQMRVQYNDSFPG